MITAMIFRKIFKDQRGSVLIIIAGAMAALIGFTALVTDIGLITTNRQRLINTMDAAALAGGLSLPDNPSEAVSVARDYALNNNYISLGYSDPEITVSSDKTSVTVSGNKDVNLAFAKIFGFYSKTVSATATAQRQYLTSVKGAVPFTVEHAAVAPGTVNPGDSRTFVFDKNGEMGPGNFGLLAFGGLTGGNILTQNIANGSTTPIYVDTIEATEPGVKEAAVVDGINLRLAGHFGCTYENYCSPACPKIITIPVYDKTRSDISGRSEVYIIGFASFFLDNYPVQVIDDKVTITGRYIETLSEGSASPTQTNYGVSTIRLIK